MHQGRDAGANLFQKENDESGPHTLGLEFGDCDNDGTLELAMGVEAGGGRVARFQSGYQLETVWSFGHAVQTNSHAVAWGDYDGDGDLDLAVGTTASGVELYKNDGTCSFTGPVWTSSPFAVSDIEWGDYDGDGDLDMAVGAYEGALRIYEYNGTTFTERIIGPEPGSWTLEWGP